MFAANRPAAIRSTASSGRDRREPRPRGGIRSTGVSSSPAVAERVRDLLAEAGAPVGEDRPDAVRALEPLYRACSAIRARRSSSRSTPLRPGDLRVRAGDGGRDRRAFAMRVPPRSLDALRKRTRATGGRCQGAFCQAGARSSCTAHAGRPRPRARCGPRDGRDRRRRVTGLACAATFEARGGRRPDPRDRRRHRLGPSRHAPADRRAPRAAPCSARRPPAGTVARCGRSGRAGSVRIAAAALVIAGGTRPQGRAQLGIAGDRPAGVLPPRPPATSPRTGCPSAGA